MIQGVGECVHAFTRGLPWAGDTCVAFGVGGEVGEDERPGDTPPSVSKDGSAPQIRSPQSGEATVQGRTWN